MLQWASVSKIIGFNADQEMRELAKVLAKRLGYRNTSEMLRTWVQERINAEIPKREQEQILRLIAHGSVSPIETSETPRQPDPGVFASGEDGGHWRGDKRVDPVPAGHKGKPKAPPGR